MVSPWLLGATPPAAAARSEGVGDFDLESPRPLQVWYVQLRLGLDGEGVDVLHGDGLIKCNV